MTNRKQIATMIAFACLICSASALSLSDFLGTWSGQRTETVNGSGTITAVKITAKKSGSALSVTETGSSERIGGSYVFKHTFKSNGRYQSVVTSYGYILSTNKGTWRKSGGAIIISGSQSSAGGDDDFSGSLKLLTPSRISYTGKSGGATVKIKAKKS